MMSTDIEDILSLSPIQKGLLFHSLYAPDAGVYFQQVHCVLRGNLDLQAFRQAWQQSINRHSILRTSFFWEDLEEPVQVVNREVTLPIEFEDWSELAESEQQSRLLDFLEEDRRRGFELSSAPLLRLALLRLDEQRYRLIWSHHHLLLDGWSIPLLLKEVFTVYRGLCWKEPVQLDQPRPYRDYITWLQRQQLEEAERYWREKLRGLKAPTTLALGNGREARAEGESEHREQRLHLTAAETAELSAVARRHQLTLNTIVQGAWGLLLSRYSGEREVLFGTTVAGRPADLRGVEQMVGVFINTLPVRVRIDDKQRVSDWLQNLQAEALEMRQYEHSPLVEVAKWSEMPRGTALFESLLVFENYPVVNSNGNGSAASSQRNGKSEIPTIEDISYYRRANYPLTIIVVPREELKWSLSYEVDRFDDETIWRMLGHFRQLLRGIATDPQQRIGDLSLLTDEERRQLLVEFNDTETEFPQNSIHQLFEQQVAQRPEAVALVCEEEQLSYGELNERANRLAHLLRGRGVGVETAVGICLPRSVEIVVSILAVLKAGGVYVPLDAEYPAERLSFMSSDAAVALVLTKREHAALLAPAGVPALYLEDIEAELATQATTNPESEVDGEHLAYIVYTSGSTGKPKGVAITQRSVSRLVFGVDYVRLDEQQCVLQGAPVTFDAATFELWGALLHGGRCVLAVERVLNSSEIGRLVRRHGVTTMWLTASLFNSVVDEDVTQLRGVQQLLVGGEALSVKHVRRAQEELGEITIVNGYGPTESTTFTCCERIGVVADGASGIPIGKPIGNTTVYVLDERMQPVALGARGELYIGGAGLARGYVGRPELTAEKFVPHPYSERGGERLYRTGDVVWQHGDGRVEFVGRLDQQVKVRGHRIELGEIEAVLQEQASIEQAVVAVREERAGDKRLVAYVVKAAEAVEGVKEWRSYLKERLPEYMVPGQFVELAELPLNANGKVDRKALPEVEQKAAGPGEEYVAPRTPIEEVLAGIWSDVLRVERVGVNDNFYELGGHSLLATQIISRVREAFGVALPIRSIFESLTLGELAYRVEESRTNQQVAPPPMRTVARDVDLPLSFAQQRLWVFDQMAPGNPVYNVPVTMRLTVDLDVPVLQQAFNEIIRRHESLRTTFPEENGQPRQIISPPAPAPLSIVDLSSLSKEVREREARRLVQQEVLRPFDLAHGPLIRAGLIKLGEQGYMVLFTMHHIVSDAWSMGVLLNEVTTLYEAFKRGEPSPLPEPVLQYADYAVWQREWLQGEVLDQQLSYWRQRLEGAPALLELPTDKPRPAIQTFRGTTEPMELSESLAADLRELSRQHNVTLFMLMLAAFQLLLHRYTGQDDIVVGTPIAGRTRVETESLIGFLVNTLALRARFTRELTFEELLRQVREVTLGAYEHQELPFENVVEELQPERSLSYNPVFQVIFSLQNTPQADPADVAVVAHAPSPATDDSGAQRSPQLLQGTAKFDFLVVLQDGGGALRGVLEYNTDLFTAQRMQRLIGHYKQLLHAIVSNPQQRVSELPLLTESEQQQLLHDFNDTAQAQPQDLYAHQLFEEQVARTPEAVAVVHEDEQLTYAELNTRANQLAHYLRGRGVGAETVVGVCLPRSIDQTVALLGVLKSGAAYLPLEPGYEAERLASLLAETNAALVLTNAELAPGLPPGVDQLVLETVQSELAQLSGSDSQFDIAPDSLAYFTQDIAITHAGLLIAIQSSTEMLGLTASDRVLELSSPTRDAHLLTVFATLLRGATLALSAANEHNVLSAPVARFLQLRREEDLSGLDTVILYGEGISPRLAESFPGKRFLHVRELPGASLFQLAREYDQAESQWPTLIPYERGSQVEFYVLDKALQPVPMGVTGELFIAVSNRQRGYAASADLTAAAFVPNPFSSEAGSRLYASGFQVRFDADGKLQHLGNSQEQVDLSGHHISLKEIEAVVTQHSAVLHTIIRVDVDEEGGKSVIAYVVPDDRVATPPALSDLREVTDYLRPAAYVVLDQLPLSAEGEVKLAALPKAEMKAVTTEYVAPQSPLEIILARIWMDVLEVEQISIHDNFFNLGGHSLLATIANLQVSDTFGVEVPVTVLFEAQTLAEFANKLRQDPNDGERIEQIATLRISMEEMANKVKTLVGKEPAAGEKQAVEKPAAGERSSPIRSVPRDADLPLSLAQQRLWVFDRMTPGSSVYNIPVTMRLTPDLDLAVLQRTFNEISRRHESLRTTFPEDNGQPRQVISPPAPVPLPIVDLSLLSKEVSEREAHHLAQQEALRPFDLAHGPLMRVGLIKLGEQGYKVLLTVHHIISDGWSMGVFLNEVTALYEAFKRGEPSPLPEPVLQYADYAVWQREWLQGEVLDQQLSYWRQHLEGAPDLLDLPTDRPRPAIQTFRGTNEALELSEDLTAKLNELSRQQNVTLFMLLLAGFQLLMHRYTGQDDIVVGTPIAGRTRVGTESLIGFFINTLPLHGRFTREMTVEELLRQMREVTLGAYAHQELPFENLMEELQLERTLSYNPLIQVILTLQNLPQSRSKAGTADAADAVAVADAPSPPTDENGAEEPPPLILGTTKFDMSLWMRESDGALKGAVEYNTDLFTAQRMRRLLSHYKQLLTAMVNNPQQRVSELPLLTESEQQLLQGFNDTARVLPQDLYAHQLFEEQVARTPEAVALVHEDEQLSYAELNTRANQLAHYLRGRGVGAETVVGVCLPRSVEQIAALLGVLKSGAAYLPLEPSYGAERLAAMIEETGARLMLTNAELAPGLPPGVDQLVLETVQPELAQLPGSDGQFDIASDNVAYFTQGIAITHAGLLTAIQSSTDMLGLTASDRVLELSSPTRDAHLLTVFATLLRGATLTLSANRANVLSAPVARFLELRREKDLSGLDTVILYGEGISPRLADSFPAKRFLHVRELPGASLFQLAREYDQAESQWPTLIPYERGSRVEFYVLDKALQPVPVGVTGELFIAVGNRQRGYAGDAQHTAAAFVPNPFSSEAGSRLYASGFQVRFDAEGKLQHLGNSQEQIDLSGHHISLKEIEAVVTQHSAVMHTIIRVDVDEEGGKSVIAYVVPDERAATLPALSDLREVTDYLRPAAYVVLDQLPLSVEGEVELAALPKAEMKAVTTEYVAPQSPLEIILAKIWMDVLEVEQISVHDNFFNLGGHSLLATMANLQVSDAFGVEIPVTVLFEAPTIAEFANKLLQDPTDGQRIEQIAASLASGEELSDEAKQQATGEMSSSPIKPVPRDADLPLSFAQQRLWVFDQMAPGSPVYNIAVPMRLTVDLDLAVLQRTFDEIIRRHESLRTTFREENGQPRQVISPPAPAPLSIVDLSLLSEEVRERETRRLVQLEAQRPFDLAHGPLTRVGLIRLGEQDHMVLLTTHHIVSDGWSMAVLVDEVTTLYTAFSSGKPSPLPEPVIQYADYAVWQREWLQGEVLEKQVSYWRQQLEGSPELLELPTDKPRLAIQTFRGTLEPLEISAELTAKLNDLARQNNVTLFMLLLAVYQLLLHRYTGQKDILVGGAIAGRTRVGTESLIGFLVNMLALRGRFTRELTFEELLRQVREVTLGAYEHQELPFDYLVEELQPERSLSYNPLIQTMFGLQNPPRSQAGTNDAADVADEPSTATSAPITTDVPSTATDDNGAERPPLLQGTAKFDLTLSLVERGDLIRGVVEYNTHLFTRQRMQRLIGHYKQLLHAIVSNPQQRVSELPLLTETEQQLLQGLNDTARALPQDLYAHQLFEEQVARTPEAVALVHEDEQLSYAELNTRANQLGHYLRARGVGAETVVGICLPRSIDQTVALLAVLKSGAAYLPLEPGYEAERLASLLAETGARLVLTNAELASGLPPGLDQLVLETVQSELAQLPTSNGQLDIAPDSLAYFTQGIAITHAGLLTAVQSSTEMLGLTANDRVLELSSPTRDAHLLTVFATLLRGATLALSANQANVLSAPVARFLELRREEDLSGLDTVILYGEGISPRLAESFSGKRFLHVRELPGASLFQLAREYNEAESQWPTLIPYERGSQVEFYVLDKAFQPVPMGVNGELFIAVGNRQRGYAGSADLTAAAFLPNPFSSESGSRLYASGFQVRFDGEGRLQHLGNSQEQIDLSGHHISLKEIEAVVTQHSAVLHTIIRVDVDEEGGKSVIAYVVPDERAATPPALSDLREVTDYLRPAAYVVLDQLPLSVEGEVELAALPKAEMKAVSEYVAPQSPLEIILAKIWMDILELEKISVHDNFFNLGGHSLLATMANLQVSDTFGIEVPVTVLFEAPTIAELAHKLLHDPTDGQRIEETAALLLSVEEMSDEEVKALIAKEEAA